MLAPMLLTLVLGCQGEWAPVLRTRRSSSLRATEDVPAVEPQHIEWSHDHSPAPQCLAYAPSTQSYACLGMTDEVDESGRTLRLFIDRLGPDGAHRDPIEGSSLPDMARVARAFPAFSVPVQVVPLPDDKWVPLADFALRVRIRVHEGDASFRYHGDVSLRCPSGDEIVIDAAARGLAFGEPARASWAPPASTLAISILGRGGGEGVENYQLTSIVINAALACRNAVVGPPTE